jgi:hypothetical protein
LGGVLLFDGNVGSRQGGSGEVMEIVWLILAVVFIALNVVAVVLRHEYEMWARNHIIRRDNLEKRERKLNTFRAYRITTGMNAITDEKEEKVGE